MTVAKILWGLLIIIICFFIVNNALPYFNFESSSYDSEDIRPFQYVLILHILFGIIAILSGPIQFYSSVKIKYPSFHKTLGKVYLFSVLSSSLASIYLAIFHAIQYKGYFTFGIGLLGLAFAWLCTSGMAYAAILKKNIAQHSEWMIRSYVVTCGFVVFRIVFGLLERVFYLPHIDSGNIAAWFSWSIPLLGCEIILQKRKKSENHK